MTANYAYIKLRRIKPHLAKAWVIDANTKRVIHSTYYNPKYSDLTEEALNELRNEASEAGYYTIDKPDLKGGKME